MKISSSSVPSRRRMASGPPARFHKAQPVVEAARPIVSLRISQLQLHHAPSAREGLHLLKHGTGNACPQYALRSAMEIVARCRVFSRFMQAT